jgi:multidrug efflux pump
MLKLGAIRKLPGNEGGGVDGLKGFNCMSVVLQIPKDRLTRFMDRAFGWFFTRFDRFFKRSAGRYQGAVARVLNHKTIAFAVYLVLIVVTYFVFLAVPHGFVPGQDKQYLVGFAQLPDGASLDRTEEVIRRMSDVAMKTPGVRDAVAFPGLSINGFVNAPNTGIAFVTLEPSNERVGKPGLDTNSIVGDLNRQFGAIQDAFVAIFPPPPVQGLGTVGGFKLYVEDRDGRGFEELYKQVQNATMEGYKEPSLAGLFSSFQVSVPQIDVHVDRERVKTYGIPLGDVFDTLQVYLGSLYANDFNRFGRTYQVNVQAESSFRMQPEQIALLKTRNARGGMVPLGSVLQVTRGYGPDQVMHYNGFPAAEINGGPSPGHSSGQAQGAMAALLGRTLPNGMTFEWTELAYQDAISGNTMFLIFPLCVLLVYGVLAAQYESFSLPFTVILIVPMTLLSAIGGVWLTGGDNNVFTQISFLVLAGLACKNSILIVEFARHLESQGVPRRTAILDACRIRLRPVLMTSVAFIMGVVPLAIATGAGAEVRRAMGVAVFAGMLGVTVFGLILTPVFYVVVQGLAERLSRRTPSIAPQVSTIAESH